MFFFWDFWVDIFLRFFGVQTFLQTFFDGVFSSEMFAGIDFSSASFWHIFYCRFCVVEKYSQRCLGMDFASDFVGVFFDFWEEETVSKIFLQRFDGRGFSSKSGRGFSAFFFGKNVLFKIFG